MARLTPKQQMFVKEYLIDLNATQAALRAGYSAKTAKQTGTENLSKPIIQAEIQKHMNNRAEKIDVSADRILQELAAIAFHDVNEVVYVDTREYVSGWKITQKETDEQPEIKEPMYSTAQMVVVKDLSELTPLQRKSIAAIKQGKEGIEIKFHDKIKAAELLGKHMKLFADKIEHSGEITHNTVDLSGLSTEELRKLAKIE
ncbi:terminase small subunit [Bacillus phage poppyseed]|uniref:Terminase small subunit n=5 Tax=Pagevirus TaxID=1921184 RepID=A0A0A0RT05_9CAUD|nr:terminase small subunit [Bacillus phage Page]YP_008771319.1 terminase small subunit [Bacillus phage Pony]YP_009152800.1 terminase small subunit [Bacillus phage Pookie]YP_009197470.1 terminase small subunit [Bacillus phage Pavlov]YP_009210036.1 terminase small subunit [Bacillus phage Palmer]AGY48018.1 terminase small subunit [Bacillus phage poppyseed]AGY47923.1 terminase small subunit [Bacillus phage Page]AGY48242.1 terminase small subunit [Bacillus phage Pony]AIW03686.1 terminase small s